MRILFFIALLFIAAPAYSADESGKSMDFSVQVNGGNCSGCAYVLAEGIIDETTLEKFKNFIVTPGEYNDLPPNNIRFNSPGGNVIEAIKFGKLLRQLKWTTFVGDDFRRNPDKDSKDYHIEQPSSCYSACVYAFVGGVHRIVQSKTIGVHQFYRPDDAANPENKTLTAADMARMQSLSALLNEHVREMGVDPRLVSIASLITPWEPIHVLSQDEIDQFNLDTFSGRLASTGWNVQPISDGAIAITFQEQDGAERIASLGFLCHKAKPDIILVKILVKDSTKNWDKGFGSGLFPQHFQFNLDENSEWLDANRLIGAVTREENGISLMLYLNNQEFKKLLLARSLKIDAFISMATQRWTGLLGGTFNLDGVVPVSQLAFKNCISN